MDTPVLVIGFNRPRKIQRVLEKLKARGCRNVFVSVDGPREERMDDENVNLVRQIISSYNSHFDLSIRFLETNYGCKKHVISAITWFFEFVNEGIILEDDCIPNDSFLPFCQELLKKHRDDDHVIMISGNNHGQNKPEFLYSYFYTRYISIWGWATWKSRWTGFLEFLGGLDQFEDEEFMIDGMSGQLRDKYEATERFQLAKKSALGQIDSWGYILSSYALIFGKLTIIPKLNLITNIGFGEDATHTKVRRPERELLTHLLEATVKHPPAKTIDNSYDEYYRSKSSKGSKSLIKRLLERL